MVNNNLKTHPSYGMIRIAQAQGSESALFGSSIKHSRTISITISQGALMRDLNADHFLENGQILRIELSPTQFADAITSIGSAVPCTLKWRESVGQIEYPEYENKKETFRKEFDKIVDDSYTKCETLIKQVQELFQKKSLNKSDKTLIINDLTQLSMLIHSHSKFIAKQFDKQMEKSVSESKGEIEAFFNSMLHNITMQSIGEKLGDMSASGFYPEFLTTQTDNKSDD